MIDFVQHLLGVWWLLPCLGLMNPWWSYLENPEFFRQAGVGNSNLTGNNIQHGINGQLQGTDSGQATQNLGAGGSPVGAGGGNNSAALAQQNVGQIPVNSQFSGYNFGAGAGGAAAGTPAYTAYGAGGSAWYSNPRLWGGLAGGIGSYLDTQSRNQGSGGSQTIDRTTDESPWGPSLDYRDQAMQRALALLNGNGGGAGGGGSQRGGGGGGGGRGGGGGGYSGSSQLADAMRAAALGGDPLVNQGRDYISNSLNDPYGGSSMMGQTFNAAQGLGDADLDQFIQNMMSDYGGGGGGGNSGGFSSGHYASGGGGGGGGFGGIGVGADLRELLDSEYGDGHQNPELEALIAAGNHGITDAYQSGLAGLSAAGNAAGAGTSSAYQLADASAAGGFARALAENETGTRYSDYERYRGEIMQALGLGTQYDLGMADVAAKNNATSASAGAAAADNATRRELGNRGLLMDAFGMRQGYQGMGLETMAGLSDLDVNNRQFMLGAIPAYHGIPLDDMEQAFGTNFGLERQQASDRSEAAARAQANSRYQANLPWQRLAQYMDIINAASGRGGQTHEYGTVPGNYQPQGSAAGSALMGALGGAQLASNLYSSYNGG